jgi:hypothetical protein
MDLIIIFFGEEKEHRSFSSFAGQDLPDVMSCGVVFWRGCMGLPAVYTSVKRWGGLIQLEGAEEDNVERLIVVVWEQSWRPGVFGQFWSLGDVIKRN